AAQAFMAIGTGLPALTQSLWSLTLSAVLVGGTMMVTTMAGLQLARELTPANPTPLLARMTSAFAAGQIAGPVLVRVFPVQSAGGWSGMTFASAVAALLLAATAAWLWRTARA
ncbi:MAG TPA: YbfB/YjiJ family MFS transporter, partial [Burkholderiaceae bacterium]